MSGRGPLWVVAWAALAAVEIRAGSSPVVEAVRARDPARVRAMIQQKIDVGAADATGETALHWAAHLNDSGMVDLLLRGGARANVSNFYGVSPLALASLNADARIVEALLRAGADPNAASVSRETPLMIAARTGSVDVVNALLKAGAAVDAQERSGQTALMWAAAERHVDIVRALLEARASVDVRTNGRFTALMFAARSGDVDAARLLVKAGARLTDSAADGRTALIVAAASGHAPLVAFLLDQGSDPNAVDRAGATPLHAAVWGNLANVTMIKDLLARGARPNVRLTASIPQRLQYQYTADLWFRARGFLNLTGATPFALAAAQADVEAMRALAAGGADPNIPMETGSTPLMLASGFGWTVEVSNVPPARALAAAKLAIELGNDVNAKNAGGRTALHAAANAGVEDLLRMLVAQGADVNAVDGDGYTPLWTAEHAQLGASVLEQRGAMTVLKELGAKN